MWVKCNKGIGTERKKAGDAVWLLGQWYLEEKCPMAVDSFADQTNGNDVRLELKLELAKVQHPWEFVQLFHLHRSAHGFTHQPDTQIHANKADYNAETFTNVFVLHREVSQCIIHATY